MRRFQSVFFDNREVRAVWNDTDSRWWFSVLDIVGVLNDQDNYEKNRNYWKYLKARLKKADIQLGSGTNQLELVPPDGKKRLSDVLILMVLSYWQRTCPIPR